MNVYYSSPWIPAEWIKAHGFEPRGVWYAPDFGRGAPPLSAGVCAFSEAVLRLAEAHHESAMIFTTTCDQMRRGFDALAAASGGRGFLFNIPATWQSPAARRIFQSELERLGRFLGELGGHAASGPDLLRLVEQGNQARHRLAAAAPLCSARQYAEAIARFHWDGSVQLPSSPPPASAAVPLAVVGGPLSAAEWSLLDVIEAAGAQVVLNATETGERSLLPAFATAGFHDDPVGALARSCFENLVDVFQRPNTRLYSWLKERLAARGARGIVLWVHTGCDLWRAEAESLRAAFGLPLLLVEADGVETCPPRNTGRLQAFVEMLK
jgi:benzoyl-CoA reductase/2-hydroxyglutaryl-CoA dehydratase subunit BcrC/BadD/HgdB